MKNKFNLSLTVKYQINTYLDYRKQLISTTITPLLKEYHAIKKCKAYCKLKSLLTMFWFFIYKVLDNFYIVVKECTNSMLFLSYSELNSDSQQLVTFQKQTTAYINLKQNSFFVLTYPINVKYGKMKDRSHNNLKKTSVFENSACKIMFNSTISGDKYVLAITEW